METFRRHISSLTIDWLCLKSIAVSKFKKNLVALPAVLETPQMLYNALMCDGVEEDAPDMDTMHLSAPLPLPSANEHTAPEGGDQKSSYEICREKVSTTTTTTTFR